MDLRGQRRAPVVDVAPTPLGPLDPGYVAQPVKSIKIPGPQTKQDSGPKPVDPGALMSNIMGMQETTHSGLNFSDPGQVDWGSLAAQYQLTPEEVQQLQIQSPAGGPSLQQRIEALRPRTQIGPLDLSTDGRRVQGRVRF